MAINVLIVGHSFVNRLEDFANRRLPEWFNLKLSEREFCVHYRGQSGGMLSSIIPHLDRAVQQMRPGIVVLVAGGNDLDRDVIDGQRVGGAMFLLASYVNIGLEVPVVAVTQLAFRFKIRLRIASVHEYNDGVIDANWRLKHLIEQENNDQIIYWNTKGIKQPTVNPYLCDGIHLNWESGMTKFSHSLKKAIVEGRKRLLNI